ncbi:MAG TPA: general secretion pathway protein GspK [Janthinobacterium sp.]|nr:general secretion pathway protein GspK [Janthinobacterium sp.]
MRAPTARQRGVAVVTALLLTTLAVTLVASLFWRQQVELRSLENQRLQLQAKWVLLGTLDWARRILREDAQLSAVDHLGEAWAVPAPETGLDDYLDSGGADNGEGGAAMTRTIVDAQSLYNLGNLAQNGAANPKEVDVLRRLLASLQLDAALAPALATALAATQKAPSADGAAAAPDLAQLTQYDDLLTVPGFTLPVIDKLKDYVVLLPEPTEVNVNTAGALVLAARMGRSAAQTGALLASRAQAYFRDEGDFENRAHTPLVAGETALQTHYFLVGGTVRIARARLETQALIYRKNTGNTTLKWVRDY